MLSFANMLYILFFLTTHTADHFIGGYRDIPHNSLELHMTPLGRCTIYQSPGHCSSLSGALWGILNS